MSKPCRIMIGEIVIVRQPVSVCVPVNRTVTLSVRAEGTALLHYQWFTDDDNVVCEVFGAREADLTVKAKKTRLYVCRVNDHFNNVVFSDWVKLKVLDIDKTGLPADWQGEPHIAINPEPQTVRPGADITLRCAAFGIPTPHYRWYRNGKELADGTGDTLQIDGATKEHAGSYLCSISNVLEERWTEAVEVNIAQQELPSTSFAATDKVALLIGNLNYSNHPKLMAPIMDVHELSNHLQHLGFRVVSLLDLTREEMLASIMHFINLLDRGVYGLFYYAGHGYEHAGRNYLVAVDAPQPYHPENCVCVQRVMLSMQKKQTALSVILLDTCRKWYNQDCAPSCIMPLGPSGNTVYGYATCEDAEAFEVQDGRKSTGIFTKYLNMHILESEKVTHVLEKVSEDLGRDTLVTGKQVVEIKHTLKEPRSLADPIQTTGHTMELHLRDFCWSQANSRPELHILVIAFSERLFLLPATLHFTVRPTWPIFVVQVLPRKKRMMFLCGVEVEVTFSALYTNVLVVFATLKSTGHKIQDCTVTLRSIPPMEDIFSGSTRSGEMGSLLFKSVDSPNCTLRICSLQKLKESLVIKVDLHYTHVTSNRCQTESQQVDVGKPLVASCKLYKRKHSSTKRQDPSTPTLGNISIKSNLPLRQAVVGPCHPCTRKAEIAAKVAYKRSNEPEENDENEL